MPVLDFTSALYLGLHHPKASLRPWEQLTTGRPAALEEPPGARAVAHKLAALVGCEGAVLVPSTLHLFWDLFGMLAHARVIIYMDAGAYPIAGWGHVTLESWTHIKHWRMPARKAASGLW
jgi:8-amino-7-oxononanoate synthase